MRREVSRKVNRVSVRDRHDPIDPKILEREVEEAVETEGDLFPLGARVREIWNQLSWRHRAVLYEFANGADGDEAAIRLRIGGGANANRIKLQALHRLATLIAMDESLPENVRQKVQAVEPSILLHLVDIYVDAVNSGYSLDLATSAEFPQLAPREHRAEDLGSSLRMVWDDLSFHERKKLYEAAQQSTGKELESKERQRLGNAMVNLKDRLKRLPDQSDEQKKNIHLMTPAEVLRLVRGNITLVDDSFQLDGY